MAWKIGIRKNGFKSKYVGQRKRVSAPQLWQEKFSLLKEGQVVELIWSDWEQKSMAVVEFHHYHWQSRRLYFSRIYFWKYFTRGVTGDEWVEMPVPGKYHPTKKSMPTKNMQTCRVLSQKEVITYAL